MAVQSLAVEMLASGYYESAQEVHEVIAEMKERVRNGEDPEEVLHEEGFEPDFVYDLL